MGDMHIKEDPALFGLIGTGIGESRSPELFRAAYGGQWAYDLLDGTDFLPLWKRFLEEYRAVNITAPFKQDAFAQAVQLTRDGFGSISGPCFKIRATNLAVKTPEGIRFDNTDFSGIILSVAEALYPGLIPLCYERFGDRSPVKIHQFLRENLAEDYGYTPQALIVGCGGAGRAAAVAAAEMGFGTALMNRTPERAQQLADEMPEYGFIPVPLSDFRASLRECDLVIYTLPEAIPAVGELTAEDFAGENVAVRKVVLEANYKTPAFSGAVRERMAEGRCRYAGGRRWLLWQAVTGYGTMTGTLPDRAAMEDSMQ